MPTTDLPTRTTGWQWLQIALLVANLWWTTLCLGGYRPETMVVTGLLNGLLLIVHFSSRALKSGGSVAAHPAGWLLLPFLIYAAANAAWITPVPWLGWHDWLYWALMIAVFWVVLNDVRTPAAQTVLLGALFGLGAVAVGLAGYQHWVKPDWLMLNRTQAPQFIGRASGPFGIPNSLAAFLLLILPAAGVLACQHGVGIVRRLWHSGLTLWLTAGLVLTISRGAWLGLALALAIWPWLARSRSWRWRLGGMLLVMGAILAAGMTLYRTMPQVHQRLDALVQDAGEKSRPIMWRGAWGIFREHPVLGGGAGSFNMLFEKFRPEKFQDDPQWAHNDYLNTLCDYGAVGFALFFGAGALITAICWKKNRSAAKGETDTNAALLQPALAIGLIAFALQLFVDFHFKIPALAMTVAATAALFVQRSWSAASTAGTEHKSSRVMHGLVAAAMVVLTLMFVLPHYRSEAARYDTRRKIDRLAREPIPPLAQQELFGQARAAFAQATHLDASNAQAWSDRAYATALWSIQDEPHRNDLGREAEGYARRALAGSQVVPEYWYRLGVALDMQGHWTDAGDAFMQALQLAPNNASTWFYQAYHLSLQPSTVPMAASAIAISLRLDPGNREAEALRRRLVASR